MLIILSNKHNIHAIFLVDSPRFSLAQHQQVQMLSQVVRKNPNFSKQAWMIYKATILGQIFLCIEILRHRLQIFSITEKMFWHCTILILCIFLLMKTTALCNNSLCSCTLFPSTGTDHGLGVFEAINTHPEGCCIWWPYIIPLGHSWGVPSIPLTSHFVEPPLWFKGTECPASQALGSTLSE